MQDCLENEKYNRAKRIKSWSDEYNFYQVVRVGFIQKDFKWNLLQDVRDLDIKFTKKDTCKKKMASAKTQDRNVPGM